MHEIHAAPPPTSGQMGFTHPPVESTKHLPQNAATRFTPKISDYRESIIYSPVNHINHNAFDSLYASIFFEKNYDLISSIRPEYIEVFLILASWNQSLEIIENIVKAFSNEKYFSKEIIKSILNNAINNAINHTIKSPLLHGSFLEEKLLHTEQLHHAEHKNIKLIFYFLTHEFIKYANQEELNILMLQATKTGHPEIIEKLPKENISRKYMNEAKEILTEKLKQVSELKEEIEPHKKLTGEKEAGENKEIIEEKEAGEIRNKEIIEGKEAGEVKNKEIIEGKEAGEIKNKEIIEGKEAGENKEITEITPELEKILNSHERYKKIENIFSEYEKDFPSPMQRFWNFLTNFFADLLKSLRLR